ncbi:MAG: agmatine deiminase family protein [Candidatus Competibacteraceae bacterium]|jgi:agmatine/peptidylarginine deiminase|nr:agmatine deiminase family protein [Candidatus Competibacteraceae bacterium]
MRKPKFRTGLLVIISSILIAPLSMADGLAPFPGSATSTTIDQSLEIIDTEIVQFDLPEQEYRAIAEFERQQGLIISWPTRTTWEYDYNTYQPVLAEIVKQAISEVVVYIDSKSPIETDRIIRELLDYGISQDSFSIFGGTDIVIREFGAGGRLWVRDYGPFFVESTDGIVDLDFRYSVGIPEPDSEKFPYSFYTHPDSPDLAGYEENALLWDGGDFLHNGDGLLLIPERVFTENVERGPHSIGDIWLTALQKFSQLVINIRNGPGLHIDWSMKFINHNTLLVGEPAEGDVITPNLAQQFEQLEENIQLLSRVNNRGRSLNIVRIPLALDKYNAPCLYINSIILNRKVLVPTCGIDADQIALDIYREQMPGYEIVAIDFSAISSWQSGGAVHCLTREIPSARSPYVPRPLWPAGEVPRNKEFVFQWTRIDEFDDYRIVVERVEKGGSIVEEVIDVHVPKGQEPKLIMNWADESDTVFTWQVGIISDKYKGWSDKVAFTVSSIPSKFP